jgi:peptide/nickel transport system permease protein
VKLSGFSFLLALVIALPLGILAAVHRNTWIDTGATMFAVLVASSPVFFTGILLILVFSYKLGWLPALGAGEGGLGTIKHLFLPALTLGISLAAITTRITRSSMVEALTQDYIETARAKGLPAGMVILKHAFRNALIPIVTVFGLLFGFLIVGTVLVEHTFGLGGLGSLLIDAVQVRDYPVVQGATIFIAGLFIVINLLVDVLYAVIDPRVRFSGKTSRWQSTSLRSRSRRTRTSSTHRGRCSGGGCVTTQKRSSAVRSWFFSLPSRSWHR